MNRRALLQALATTPLVWLFPNLRAEAANKDYWLKGSVFYFEPRLWESETDIVIAHSADEAVRVFDETTGPWTEGGSLGLDQPCPWPNGEFRTSDIDVAARLQAAGVPLKRTVREEGRCYFIFEPDFFSFDINQLVTKRRPAGAHDLFPSEEGLSSIRLCRHPNCAAYDMPPTHGLLAEHWKAWPDDKPFMMTEEIEREEYDERYPPKLLTEEDIRGGVIERETTYRGGPSGPTFTKTTTAMPRWWVAQMGRGYLGSTE